MIDPAFTLEKKTAIVVGAANGIGRATALAFAAAGARVACADIEEPGAKTTAAEIEKGGGQALPVPLDVTDGASCRAAVAATVQRFGGLDVLLYGAADSDRTATVLEMDEATWDAQMDVNLKSAYLGIKHVLPLMLAHGGGAIVNISTAWVTEPSDMFPTSAVFRAGLLGSLPSLMSLGCNARAVVGSRHVAARVPKFRHRAGMTTLAVGTVLLDAANGFGLGAALAHRGPPRHRIGPRRGDDGPSPTPDPRLMWPPGARRPARRRAR